MVDLDAVLATLPDDMGENELVSVLGVIITGYTRNATEARDLIRVLLNELANYYSEVCTCPKCTEARNRSMN